MVINSALVETRVSKTFKREVGLSLGQIKPNQRQYRVGVILVLFRNQGNI